MPSIAARRPSRQPRSRGWWRSALIVGLVALAALAIRSLVAMPRSIPSESMMPGLLAGDSVIVAKWPYGWSRYSLPGTPGGPAGRLFGREPRRGDVVVFRAPPDAAQDFIKRVIALPGDTVAMRGGRLWLNGRIVPRARIADLVLPITPAVACMTVHGLAPGYGRVTDAGGRAVCRLPRYREWLPDGRSYHIIEQARSAGDEMVPLTVPAGHYFLMGDNRDVSDDSRFPVAAGGIGLVPADDLEGRAELVFFSTGGGGARWNPLGWLGGVRLERIGGAAA